MLKFKQVNEARKILGLDEEASIEEIKRAFRDRALKYHPDKCGDKEKIDAGFILSLELSH